MSVYTILVVATFVVALNVDSTKGAYLRATGSDPCFQTHLDNCESCIVDGSSRCGYCHTSPTEGKCASVVGDANKPAFHCATWTKPNLPAAPTSCKRSTSHTADRVDHTPEKHAPPKHEPLKAVHEEIISDKTVRQSPSKVVNLAVREDPKPTTVGEKPNTHEKKETIVEKKPLITPKTVSSRKIPAATGAPAMSTDEMSHLTQDLIGELSVDQSTMQHEYVEWVNAHKQDNKAKDGRNINWEEIKKHMEGNKDKQAELHYLQKEENENIKRLVKRKNVAENTLKHRIADRDVRISEREAVNHKVNADDILDKNSRPDHVAFNKYLGEKDKELNSIVGSQTGNYARVSIEHSRHAANEVDDDNTTPIGMTKRELKFETNKFNDMEGHLSPNSYEHSIDPNEHNIGQKGYW